MPYFEIDDELLNTLDEDLKQKLKAYQPEDTQGLKDKANQLLSEKKAGDAKLAEAQAEVAALTASIKKTKAPVDQDKLDDALAKLAQAQEENNRLKNERITEKLNSEAMKLASGLTKDTRRASLLAEQVRNRIQYEGDSLTVLSKDGKPTISSLDDLTNEIKLEYDFLVDGSQASGGGATGGNGGAGNSAKTIKYSDYKQLSAHEKGALNSKGIQVIDD